MSISASLIFKENLMGRVHRHQLIKNEDYHAGEGDLCYGCGLFLCKSSVVYHCIHLSTSAKEDDCAHLFLHKNCAHLPIELVHPSHKEHTLKLSLRPPSSDDNCDICGIKLKWFTYWCYNASKCKFQVCVACVIPINNSNIHPPYHPHKLTLLASLARFRCDVCHTVDTDFSYMCYTCPFWIHLNCNNLPTLLTVDIHHKHPLILEYSLPKIYRTFPQTCRICRKNIDPSDWLYYCPNCRFFAHIKCATSTRPTREISEYPSPEYESLLHQCFKEGFLWWMEDVAETPLDHINVAETPLDHINHWSHEHRLLLKNKSVSSSTSDHKEGLISPICNGCTEYISTNDDVFYECRECDYILHTYCAHFPKEMRLYIRQEIPTKYVGIQPSVDDIWSCTVCEGFRNGTQMQGTCENYTNFKIDSGCAALFKIEDDMYSWMELHADFRHRLNLEICPNNTSFNCVACHKTISGGAFYYCDDEDDCYCLHIKCALKPRILTHRWDPHPLRLILSPGEVTDHPHEYQCEVCSEEINTNYWFYHCSVCDLSFHFGECIDFFTTYSKIKFGATNIKIDAHPHDLTFVLNNNRQPCHRCHKNTYGEPVLKCEPCKFIQHAQPDLCTVGHDG